MSEPVEHEVKVFTARGRQVISIVFGDNFEELDSSKFPTLQRMSGAQLYIEDVKDRLAKGKRGRRKTRIGVAAIRLACCDAERLPIVSVTLGPR